MLAQDNNPTITTAANFGALIQPVVDGAFLMVGPRTAFTHNYDHPLLPFQPQQRLCLHLAQVGPAYQGGGQQVL